MHLSFRINWECKGMKQYTHTNDRIGEIFVENIYLILALFLLFAYFCGSIPAGYLICKKLYGIDIRTKGSGNIGSTNVNRILGRKASIYTQIIDITKGVVPVVLSIYLTNVISMPISKNLIISIVALTVILGHDYTPFLKFNGGKGVNTTIGAFFFIAVIPTVIGILAYFALKLFTPIVSLRSITLSILIFLMCDVLAYPIEITAASGIAFLLLIYRHKDNLYRLARGEEG